MISVVVPTLNEAANLPAFFSSLEKSKFDDYEVVVVDGRSRDDTVSVAERLGARVVMEKLPGIGRARNAGLKAARGAIVASADADAVLCEGWLDRIAWNFEARAGLKALSGPSSYGNAKYDIWSFATQWQNNFTPITGFAYLGANNSAYDAEYLRRTGGWSEDKDEEIDVSLRIFLKRAKVRYDWELRVRLSDRRFGGRGFLRTVAGWSANSVAAIAGVRRDLRGYSDWRK